jgi:cytidylate kinase
MHPEKKPVITIDGPAGSGKSSTAKALARQLGWRSLDTGSLYRSVAFYALRFREDPDDEEACAKIAQRLVDNVLLPRHGHVICGSHNISKLIRRSEVAAATPRVSNLQSVRDILGKYFLDYIGSGEIVVEGRDAGTILCPDAFLKLHLTASEAVRYERRGAADAAAKARINERDRLDSTRAVAPLQSHPDDTTIIDTSDLAMDEVLAKIIGYYKLAISA